MENIDVGADKYPRNTPNAPKFMLFGISMKKSFIGRP